jgi:predicted dehydrogenase
MNTQNLVRVGVVGTSNNVIWNHIPPLQSHAQAKLWAICGRNPKRTSDVASEFSIPRAYTNYHEMIESGELDAVVVAAPDQLHFPITIAALKAGLHVLCEKPLAMNRHDAKHMLDTAERQGLIHMTMFNWRWVPYYRQIYKLIDEGYLGQLHSMNLRWPTSFGNNPTYMWRTDAAYGNGALADLGAHIFDLARLFAGDIRRVSAHLTSRINRPHPDGQQYETANDSAIVLLEFVSGAQGTVELTYTASIGEGAPGEHHFELQGSTATIRAYASLANGWMTGACKNDQHFVPLQVDEQFTGGCDPSLPFADRFFPLFNSQSIGDRQFIDAILGKSRVWPTFFDGWKAAQVIDAAMESYRTGCWAMVDS